MNRRTFAHLAGGIAAGAASGSIAAGQGNLAIPFKMGFGPHPNLLPGTGKMPYLDQLQFAFEHGFRAWEDNKLHQQEPGMQEKIGAFCREKHIQLGVMVITGGNGMFFAKPTEEGIEKVLADMRRGVEVAKRTGQTWMTMIPGPRLEDVPLDEQLKGSVDVMKRCCDIVEGHGIILVQEPLSHGVEGGTPLLRSFEDGFKLCELVERKSCKLLADFYHEGTLGLPLIDGIEKTWSQVAYIQYGDVPGRKEPGTGKLDYKAVTAWLHKKGYKGVIGMEHGSSVKGQKGLQKLIDSYRAIDVA